jgi:hypothetical protein
MKTLVIFIGLLVGAAFVGLGLMMFGWYMLVPAVIGLLWGIAKHLAQPKPGG